MMRRFLQRFSGGPPLAAVPPLSVDATVSIVGDVHGCDALLDRLLHRIEGQIVIVGDIIDRGESSAAVMDRLIARPDIICLLGNHEAMCLAFLDNPVENGARWLRNGGLQTLASFGVGGSTATGQLPRLRDALALAMGDDRINWMRHLPLWWQSGNLVVTHAGADPSLPLGRQKSRDLLWGHRDFGRKPRADGLWVAHGHTIVPEPFARNGTIAVDTGAYATGRLSATVLDGADPRFVIAT